MKKFLTITTIMMFLLISSFAFAGHKATPQCHKVHDQTQGQAQGQIQGQAQAQIQGQLQGQAQMSNNNNTNLNANANVNVDNSVAVDAPIPGSPEFGALIGYYGQPTPSEGYQPIEQLTMYHCWFSEASLESMLEGARGTEAEFKVSNGDAAVAKLDEDGITRWIKIVISQEKYTGKNAEFKGFVTARSNNRRNTMTEVMAKAALSAMKNDCNVIHFTAQGAVRDVMSRGWGIGFNTTQAQVYSNDMSKSNVSSGGMGYSRAQAGVRDLPWLQGFGLVDNDLIYPVLKK